MVANGTVKGSAIVGVIASATGLRKASRMVDVPDLFELRLDALVEHLDAAERFAGKCPRPLIITARHPAEGGLNALNSASRSALLARFLPCAKYIDVELRSMPSMRRTIGKTKRLIVSVHDFRGTPTIARMNDRLNAAREMGADVFKIATTTDTPLALSRLLTFANSAASQLPIVAMGVGKYGLLSRLVLSACGAPLVYAAVDSPVADGQPSIPQMRALLREFAIC